jgi:hypothetical protein
MRKKLPGASLLDCKLPRQIGDSFPRGQICPDDV